MWFIFTSIVFAFSLLTSVLTQGYEGKCFNPRAEELVSCAVKVKKHSLSIQWNSYRVGEKWYDDDKMIIAGDQITSLSSVEVSQKITKDGKERTLKEDQMTIEYKTAKKDKDLMVIRVSKRHGPALKQQLKIISKKDIDEAGP